MTVWRGDAASCNWLPTLCLKLAFLPWPRPAPAGQQDSSHPSPRTQDTLRSVKLIHMTGVRSRSWLWLTLIHTDGAAGESIRICRNMMLSSEHLLSTLYIKASSILWPQSCHASLCWQLISLTFIALLHLNIQCQVLQALGRSGWQLTAGPARQSWYKHRYFEYYIDVFCIFSIHSYEQCHSM